ncbi:MAG: serine hydrolase, partial [Clostridia bacterium]|nr:serine hydrolase [Clostridia bacterium]
MKNPRTDELAALRARSTQLLRRFPKPVRGDDGRLSPQSRAQAEAAMRRILRANRAVGAALVLVPPSGAPEEVFTDGFARLRPRMPVGDQTCFRAASVSKLVMTFGALSLVASEQLGLDADISEVLGYPVRPPHLPDS